MQGKLPYKTNIASYREVTAYLAALEREDGPGREIQEAREMQHMTQRQVAQAVGCTPSSVDGWEKGRFRPEAENIQSLCETLGILPGVLLGEAARMRDLYPEECTFLGDLQSLSEEDRALVMHVMRGMIRNAREEMPSALQKEYRNITLLTREKTESGRESLEENAFFVSRNSGTDGIDRLVALADESLAPAFHEGEFLTLSQDKARVGETGLYLIDGKTYLLLRKGTTLTLPDHPRVEVPLREASCLGRVTGSIKAENLPRGNVRSALFYKNTPE